MASYLDHVGAELGWMQDGSLSDQLHAKNKAKIEAIEAKIKGWCISNDLIKLILINGLNSC